MTPIESIERFAETNNVKIDEAVLKTVLELDRCPCRLDNVPCPCPCAPEEITSRGRCHCGLFFRD